MDEKKAIVQVPIWISNEEMDMEFMKIQSMCSDFML